LVGFDDLVLSLEDGVRVFSDFVDGVNCTSPIVREAVVVGCMIPVEAVGGNSFVTLDLGEAELAIELDIFVGSNVVID